MKEKVEYTHESVEGKLGGSKKTRLTESAWSRQEHTQKLGELWECEHIIELAQQI